MPLFDPNYHNFCILETMAVFGCVKAFPENFLFSGNAIFRKGKCIQVFGCLRITENQFRCLVCTNILWKMTSVLRKINSHVWFGQSFYGKWNSFFYRKSILMFGLWIILWKITISSTWITDRKSVV